MAGKIRSREKFEIQKIFTLKQGFQTSLDFNGIQIIVKQFLICFYSLCKSGFFVYGIAIHAEFAVPDSISSISSKNEVQSIFDFASTTLRETISQLRNSTA